MERATQCIHSGTRRDPVSGGVNTPVYASSACDYLDREEVPYPRYFNMPNQRAVVEKLCALEGAEDGVLFSSGMAAITTAILACVQAGDHIVLQEELYGGTHAFATSQLPRLGIDYTLVPTDAAAIGAAITERTRLVVLETPTNPLLSLLDIRQTVANARGVLTLIDNTFASPVLQNPLQLGVDMVVHSATKYLGGHSDLCSGVVLTRAPLAARILALARHMGGSLNPQDCALLERSIKTLVVRMERQTANAGALATRLREHPLVQRVYYPGLPDHPGHAIAHAQMRGFGAMLSFEVATRRVDPAQVLQRLRLIAPAASLGGVETTICAPAQTSHARLTADQRARIGITDALLRLSVGIEDADDLMSDLEQALGGAGAPR